MKRIAVTGGLACGKSSVCHILQELGAYVISADAIVHQLLDKDENAQESVIDLLGEEVTSGGELDRQKIAAAVFDNPERLAQLESILHPKVFEEIDHHYQLAQEKEAPLFVVEIPLLFEIKSEGDFDMSVAVVADEGIAQGRFGKGTEEFERRSRHQLSPEEKGARADIIINNNDNPDALRREVKSIFNTLVGAV